MYGSAIAGTVVVALVIALTLVGCWRTDRAEAKKTRDRELREIYVDRDLRRWVQAPPFDRETAA